MFNYSKEDLGEIIKEAVDILKKNHPFLLEKKNNLNERTVTSQLRAILAGLFSDYDVDSEYNRMNKNGNYKPKAIEHLEGEMYGVTISIDDVEAKTVIPDIIVHQRGTDNNYLAIEVKMAWKSGEAYLDERKLVAYTRKEKGLGYLFGLYLEIGENGIKKTDWFIDGQKIDQ